MKRRIAHTRLKRFFKDVFAHTPFTKVVVVMIVLWLVFAAALSIAERGIEGSPIDAYGEALYWGVAAFSTAGIATEPVSTMGKLVGGLWIVIGSLLFFGGIVATITTYFMRPMQRPHKKIIDTVEYNLEQLDDLSVDELDLLKETVDTLIAHVERLKERQAGHRQS